MSALVFFSYSVVSTNHRALNQVGSSRAACEINAVGYTFIYVYISTWAAASLTGVRFFRRPAIER